MVIGGEDEKTALLLYPAVKSQNIVEIVHKNQKIDTEILPRGIVPIISEVDIKDKDGTLGTKTLRPEFGQLDHVFGRPGLVQKCERLFAYRYSANPVDLGTWNYMPWLILDDELTMIAPVVERIFAQRIFMAVISSLMELEGAKTPKGFKQSEMEWLAQTFVRERLGSNEEAYFCMFPARWTDKHCKCSLKFYK